MIKKFKEKIEKHLEEVLEIKTSPESIAAGFALGTLIALLPTFGLGVFIGLSILLIFKRISKISMVAAFIIWNPIILIGLAPLEYKIGDFLVGEVPVQVFRFEVLNQIFTYSRRFLIGNFIVSLGISMISYFTVKILTKSYHKGKLLKNYSLKTFYKQSN